jgi:uncharacterized protein (TIGR03067 family)
LVIVTDDEIFIGPSDGVLPDAGEEFNPPTWSYRLDPAKSPKEIDLAFGDKSAAGIYSIDGDILRLCVTEGARRPTDFSAPGGTPRDYYIAVRQSGEGAANPLDGEYRFADTPDSRVTIKGKLFVVRVDKKEVISTITVDESSTPGRFDAATPQADKTSAAYGIYRFDDERREELSLSFVENTTETERPEDFQPGGRVVVMKLQRVPPDELRDEKAAARLQGRWEIELPYQSYGARTILVTDQSLAILGDDDKPIAGGAPRHYRVNAALLPHEIDLKDDQVWRGIYWIERDELRIAIGAPDQERPAQLDRGDFGTEYYVAKRTANAKEQ